MRPRCLPAQAVRPRSRGRGGGGGFYLPAEFKHAAAAFDTGVAACVDLVCKVDGVIAGQNAAIAAIDRLANRLNRLASERAMNVNCVVVGAASKAIAAINIARRCGSAGSYNDLVKAGTSATSNHAAYQICRSSLAYIKVLDFNFAVVAIAGGKNNIGRRCSVVDINTIVFIVFAVEVVYGFAIKRGRQIVLSWLKLFMSVSLRIVISSAAATPGAPSKPPAIHSETASCRAIFLRGVKCQRELFSLRGNALLR